MVLAGMTPAGYAHTGKKGSHKPTVKHASHELKEASEILNRLPADADGHVAKAKDLVAQAEQELAAVKS